jgi:hypothetical protein
VKKERFDAVTEKCEIAVRDMHRPIVHSETAEAGYIDVVTTAGSRSFQHPLSQQTYDHMKLVLPDGKAHNFVGRVSGYNLNTFKGRVFIADRIRPISFEVSEGARTTSTISAIVRSLAVNAGSRTAQDGVLRFSATPIETRTGRLKGLIILGAE